MSTGWKGCIRPRQRCYRRGWMGGGCWCMILPYASSLWLVHKLRIRLFCQSCGSQISQLGEVERTNDQPGSFNITVLGYCYTWTPFLTRIASCHDRVIVMNKRLPAAVKSDRSLCPFIPALFKQMQWPVPPPLRLDQTKRQSPVFTLRNHTALSSPQADHIDTAVVCNSHTWSKT